MESVKPKTADLNKAQMQQLNMKVFPLLFQGLAGVWSVATAGLCA